MTKIVYQTSIDGMLVGVHAIDESDRNPFQPDLEAHDAYLIPGGCVEIAPPTFDAGKFARFVDGAWVIEDIPVVEDDLPATSDMTLSEYLAQTRWAAEIGGAVWSGWVLPTDDRSQSKYLAELAAVNEGVRQDGQLWKFPHGFEPLTNQQVRDMAIAARAHVLACFGREAEVAAQITAGIITTIDQIDAAFEDMAA